MLVVASSFISQCYNKDINNLSLEEVVASSFISQCYNVKHRKTGKR
ncbi:hypothetical protein AABM17_2136 [Neisseria musculi]|uniref:Uncharacterized protein n=1 Tax=Neisseria musculi TaxID=1815583 RepID=A0A7H1M8I7_9NEIS|nr:hypothetical protein H7A79_2135 [Neisseria musculi]